jgi:GT2 family glycosyltransferase
MIRTARHNRTVSVAWTTTEMPVGADRGGPVVCIPVYGAHEHFVNCLYSVLTHTPPCVQILVSDDASPDDRSVDFVRRLEREGKIVHELTYLRREGNVGFPANVNGAFAMAAPGDVVVLNSDCLVAAGWLERLRAAAYSESRVATATAVTNHGSIVSVPEGRPTPTLPQEWTFDDAAAAVQARALRIYPRLPTAIGHCMYIRRSALELVGDFDLAFSPGYGEEVDFSQRCRKAGLSHVLADDVLVLHHGGGSFTHNGRWPTVQEQHERMIAVRYPYYHDEVHSLEKDVTGPLPRALGAARRALKGLAVVIDARILSGPMTGTQLQVLEVIAALDRTKQARLTVVMPDGPSDYAVQALRAINDVALVTRHEASSGYIRRADVVHRPYQISHDDDLVFLARLGERLVITNQDLIGYHNPSYFKSPKAWDGYRRLTRIALAVADHVIFVSAHARADALAEDLIDPARASAVHNGVDHSFAALAPAPVAPRAACRLPVETEAILCLGTDFRHKNRLFALRTAAELRRRHGWEGFLLFAGPRVEYGSSAPDEAEALALQPELANHVLEVAAVTEAEKAWLFSRARIVLYPTVHEGFGLVPFEGADYAVPCLWAPGTSLSEILPDDAAKIIPWDAVQTADHALELMREDELRERNLEAIRAAGAKLTWDAAAAELLRIYNAACDAPAAAASATERRSGILNGVLSEDAMALIGPSGLLPSDVERPLLALATHPQIGKPMFRAIKLGYEASYKLRRLRGNG